MAEVNPIQIAELRLLRNLWANPNLLDSQEYSDDLFCSVFCKTISKAIDTLTKNGTPITQPVQLASTNKAIADLVNGQLMALAEGSVDIIITLQNYPAIYQKLTIQINTQQQEFSAYIEGPASIRLDRQEVYTLKGTSEIIGEVKFSINNTQLAWINNSSAKNQQIDTTVSCVVRTNKKNKLQKFILSAEYNNNVYTKEISIIPLW